MEPIGDPDDDGGDFAEEHESTDVNSDEEDAAGEQESPGRFTGGLENDGPP